MAITGAIFNSLTFGGVNSADYGIYITGEAVFNAPKRAVEMVTVPGRNGDVAIDQGRWKNIEVTYPAGTFGMSESEFATAISNFRNAILSQIGYQRLSDTYNPDEYRMAVYTEGLEVEASMHNRAGEFELKFNCKPQRWLTSGEIPVTIGEWGATKTASGEIVTIESDGGETAKSLEVSLSPIQSLNGYDAPWIGGAGKNKLPSHDVGTVTTNGLTITYYNDGTLKITGTATASTDVGVWNSGNVAEGIQGSYKLNGCTNGAGSKYQLIARVRNTSASTNRYIPLNNGDVEVSTSSTEVINSVYINVKSGIVMNDVRFYPMLRLSTVSDATFEPYTNICPISGRTSVETTRMGKNLLTYTETHRTISGVSIDISVDGVLHAYGTAREGLWVAVGEFEAKGGKTYFYGNLPRGMSTTTYFVTRYGSTGNTYEDSEYTFANDTNAVSRLYVRQGVTLDVTFKLVVADAETAQTYTTALGRTVYGGTLDVVSGVLTVDKAMITLDGSEDEAWTGANTRFAIIPDGVYRSGTGRGEVLSNEFVYSSSATTVGTIFLLQSNGQVYVYPPVSDSLANFKTWLASNPLQVVYPLATPQTYQLTSQQIELLVGENHVWSDGAITLQYGDDPNSLYNPTRYDASPLLAVDGYGTISFNGYDIEITSGDYGDITIASPGVVDTNGDFYTIPAEYIKNGDTVTFTGLKLFCPVKFKSSNNYHFYGDGWTAPVPSDTNSDATSRLDPNRMPLYGTNATNIVTEVPSVRFTIGTSETWEDVITVAGLQVTEDYGETLLTEMTLTVTIRIDYDATTQKITFSESMRASPSEYADSIVYYPFGYRWYPSRIESVVVNSTMTYLGEPTYIDCDLGEAYKIENGTFISLNSYIDLGSDLPTLASGQNEITIDDTITSLEVTPRWWKL